MPTKSLVQFHERPDDIERLLEAHKALSQLRQIEAAATGQTDILRALSVAQRAFAGPARGRRWKMEALNRAGIVLLVAHLEGYVEDLFAEASGLVASAVFDTRHYSTEAFVRQGTSSFRNPKPENIRELFKRLGLQDMLGSVHWGSLTNSEVRSRLGDLVSLRNDIAHGKRPSVTRLQLRREVAFSRRLARHLDKRLYDYLLDMADVRLW
jgi:RiboL-PSP-HEPN